MNVSEMMKECAALGLKIDQTPDYPIQLNYMDGVFTASYEPNFDGVMSEEGETAEIALQKLIEVLRNV